MAKHLSAILKSYSDVISGKLPAAKVSALKTGDNPGVDYAGKMPDEREFVASHSVEKHADRNGNGDDLFNAANIKTTPAGRHGHLPKPEDIKTYQQANEEVEELDETSPSNKPKKNRAAQKVGLAAAKAGHSDFNKKIRADVAVKRLGRQIQKEAKDEGEYGYEGEMAISQIKSIMNHSSQLMKMLKPDTDLPEWVQSKITLAADYMQTAADYLATEMNEAIEDPTIVARKKKMDNEQQTHEIEFADKPGQKFKALGPAPETHEIEFADKPGQKFTAMGPAPKAQNIGSDGKPYQSSIYPDDAETSIKDMEKRLSSGALYKPYLKSSQYKNLRDLFKEAAMCENCGKSPCACDADDMPKGKSSKGKKLLLDKAKKSLQEKAESVAQQKLMAMALAYKRGEMKDASPQVKKLADSMTEKQLRDYAKTKHEGLPQKVQKESAPASTPITFPVTNSREGFKL